MIKNIDELSASQARTQLLTVLERGLESVDPLHLIHTSVRYSRHLNAVSVHNRNYAVFSGRIFVIGAGKAAVRMAEVVERHLGPEHVTAGLVVSYGGPINTTVIKSTRGGHPRPNFLSTWAARRILSFKDKYRIGQKDIVICLLSGGGSSMIERPVRGLTLGDLKHVSHLLSRSGAGIEEVNLVRKHLSQIKGGQLARHFAPAKVIGLIISDVPGDDLAAVASGPTMPDSGTFADVRAVLEKYEIWDKIPARARRHIEEGQSGQQAETPKTLDNADNYLVGSNTVALSAMAHRAREFGLRPHIIDSSLRGTPEEVAALMSAEVRSGKHSTGSLLLFSGESTPKVRDAKGIGGRNLHLCGRFAEAMAGFEQPWTMISINTDGKDGPTEAAGAIVDQDTLHRASARNLDITAYFNDFDSGRFFDKLGSSLIMTGKTGTNVADIMAVLL